MDPSFKENPCDLAIIGMACLFPASQDKKAFLKVIFRNIDAIEEVPDSHWSKKDYFEAFPGAKDMTYCTKGGYLAPYPFDPAAFSIPPNLLEVTDTSQLLALVTAKAALEDAGYGDKKDFDSSKASIIIGATGTQELVVPLASRLGHPLWKKAMEDEGLDKDQIERIKEKISASYTGWQENSFPGLLGNVIAGRIANRLDLHGSNCVVDAACGSSLAALHMAALELKSKKADMVITGGVDTLNDIFMHMCFAQTGVLSHSGDARPFSENADGTVLGEGLGLVVLKRLEDAKKDKDNIYAVIKGIGTSSDGKSQSIYAPGEEGQIRALKKACLEADLPPESIELIEAHGTGTTVGDLVEFEALKKVYGQNREKASCVISSIKANIGHTKAAAGSAGLIKTALCLYHKILPSGLKHLPLNPKLDMENSAFHILEKPLFWAKEDEEKRRAAVSAFGFGGANYHAILEEYDKKSPETAWDFYYDIFSASAEDKSSLLEELRVLEDFDPREPRILQEICLNSRKNFLAEHKHRLLIIIEDKQIDELLEEARKIIEEEKEGKSGSIFYGQDEKPGKLAFLFPGQGSQYTGMGNNLSCIFPEMQEVLKLGDLALKKEGAEHRKKELLSKYIFSLEKDTKKKEEKLRSTDIAQAAIGSISLGMLRILKGFKIEPHALCGHSYGELPALCFAGVFSEEDCLKLSVLRGRYMAGDPEDKKDRGRMMAVKAGPDQLYKIIKEENLNIVLANKNSPLQSVLSGSSEDIENAAKVLKKYKIRGIQLPVAAAFHSPLVEDAAKPFEEALGKIEIKKAKIPCMSNASGDFYPEEADKIAKTLALQLSSPVHFMDNIKKLFESGVRTFVEIGPKNVLSNLVSSILESEEIYSMALDASSGKNEEKDLLELISMLSALGYKVNWDFFPKPPENPKGRMKVWISGANIKSEKKEERKITEDKPKGLSEYSHKNISEDTPEDTIDTKTVSMDSDEKKTEENQTLNPKSKDKRKVMDKALVIEALQTLRQLQEQSSQAHKQFLSLQSEASRTLASIFKGAGEGMEPSFYNEEKVSAYKDLSQEEEKEGSLYKYDDYKEKDYQESTIEEKELPEENHKEKNLRADFKDDRKEDDKSILNILKEIIARQTGYPEEMIQEDMDLESELGIDSIKRVEIFSELEQIYPELAKFSQEELASARSIKKIAGLIDKEPLKTKEDKGQENSPINLIKAIIARQTGYPEEMIQKDMDLESELGIDSIKRVEIFSELEQIYPELAKFSQEELASARSIQKIKELIEDQKKNCFISESKEKTKEVEESSLIKLKRASLVWEKFTPEEDNFSEKLKILKNFADEKELEFLKELISDKEAELITCKDNKDFFHKDLLIPWKAEAGKKELKELFFFLSDWGRKALKSDKKSSLRLLIRSDGRLGHDDPFSSSLESQSLGGLVLSLNKEWSDISIQLIDIALNSKIDKKDFRQLIFDKSQSIKGFTDKGEFLAPRLKELEDRADSLKFPFPEKDDLILVTGGAYGVTANCIKALAAKHPCHFILTGRSKNDFSEPLWLMGIEDEKEIKKALLRHNFKDKMPKPVELEKSYKDIISKREIKKTIKELESYGCKADYLSIDINDKEALKALIDKIEKEGQTPSYWIHGAGVLADKPIVEKKEEDFERVFNTKAISAKRISEVLNKDKLKGMVLFSSVASIEGNPGQTDYALANAFLNALARQKAFKREDLRSLSIAWGPWEGGMVDSSLAKHFQRQGIELIPLKEGAEAFYREIFCGDENKVLIAAENLKADLKKK